MWAKQVLTLDDLRKIPGLENLTNRAVTDHSDHVHPELTHLSEVMSPAIEQIQENVYSAVGFDVANTTFVIGDDGVILIDAMTSIENMRDALLAFRSICQLPITAMIYSHSHGDHWAGSPAVFDQSIPGAAAEGIPVIAQTKFLDEVGRINGVNQPIMAARSAYQFGGYLPTNIEGRINVGAGPFLGFNQSAGLVPPNTLVEDKLELTVSGLRMVIEWAPSEAPDELVTWFPDLKLLQSAEVIQGECYPNLYTIRGDVPRPAAQWIRALDKLRGFPADALAKSHGRSVAGAADVAEHLVNYRDVIAWTHDQTIRRMNQGLIPDQIVEALGEMPPHLRNYETSGTEGYGSVPHGSRAIYNWYLGFNLGETTNFDPAPYQERQRGYVDAMGGADRVIELAQAAVDEGNNQWAIELLGYVVRSDHGNTRARELSALAHTRRGYEQHNATWRNWYLSAAQELLGNAPVALSSGAERDVLLGQPTPNILAGLVARIRAEQTFDVRATINMQVVGEPTYGFELRRGVLELTGAIDKPDVTMVFSEKGALVDYLRGTTYDEVVKDGLLSVTGDEKLAARFADYFDPAPNASRIYVTLHGEVS